MSEEIKERFRESQKSHATLLLNTLSPIISLNISLGLDDANREYLDEIKSQNSIILLLQLQSDQNKTLYNYNNMQANKKIIENNFFQREIFDSVTHAKIATLKIYISNTPYEVLLEKNKQSNIEVFAASFLLLIIFIFFLKREFRPLSHLAEEIAKYDPRKNNFTTNRVKRDDEIGVIHNAIVSMVERIESAADENEKTNILLAQQSKMASLGEMLASISHQWKQPLSIISSITIKLKLECELDKLEKSGIETSTTKIAKQLTYMTQTLSDFSNFFKPNKKITSFSVKEAIEGLLFIFGKEYELKNIIINISENRAGRVDNYVNELQQVVLNILNNARDVIVEKELENRNIDIDIRYFSEGVEIKIKDYAGGISTKYLDTIFDAYVTTKKEEKGTGIGLYMSKRLVEESMHGNISVKNVDGGAEFTIILPSIVSQGRESL